MEDNKTSKPVVIHNDVKPAIGLATWIMGGVILGLTVANGFLFWRSNETENQLARLQNSINAELVSLRDHDTASNAAIRKSLEAFQVQVQEGAARADVAATRARSNAQKHAEKLVQTLTAEAKAREAQIEQAIGEVKQASQGTEAKVTEIVTDIGAVRGEVAETKSTLDSTLSDLKSVRGDLGVQSGLIATNSRELAALREMGERNYLEFNFAKTDKPQRIGSILVAVKKTDVKRNKYSLDVIADDRKVEKKDKYVNEPVQFYVQGSRVPYELVVNEVRKDRVIGYLATPKVVAARR